MERRNPVVVTLGKLEIGGRKCFPAPDAITFAALAYNDNEEAVYRQTIAAIIAGAVPLATCPLLRDDHCLSCK